MSKLVYGITRIVPRIKQEVATSKRDLLVFEFISAYEELMRALDNTPHDLHIHLSIETNDKILPPRCDGNHGGPRCADPECWNQ